MSNERFDKLVDCLTIKLPGDQGSPESDPPKDLTKDDKSIEGVYDFFTKEELYHRYHINIVGIREKTFHSGKRIQKYKSSGLLNYLDEVDPSIEVETVGHDTGSSDYFPIGKCSFTEKTDNNIPIWDKKQLVMGKKDGIDSIKFTMKDGDKDVFEYSLKKKDFPEVGPDWKTYTIKPHAQDKYKMDGLEFVFKMRVSACTDKISSKEDLANFLQDTDTVTYTEEVITAAEKHDYSLVQCWRHKEASSKAVLWFLGRNDCFMHPHVAKPLFLDKGYDLFVLNYSMDGMCRKRGWVEDAWFNSHNYVSNFDIYDDQVKAALEKMKGYDRKLGYAHSTGGPVLLNYLMNKGDDDFDGFIFNSPFMDLAFGDAAEAAVDSIVPIMSKLGLHDFSDKEAFSVLEKIGLSKSSGPVVQYLKRNLQFSAWSARIWSQFFFDFRSRPLFSVAVTMGFTDGVLGVHKKITNGGQKISTLHSNHSS